MTDCPRWNSYLFGWFVLLSGLALFALQPSSGTDFRYHWAAGSLPLGAGLLWALKCPRESLRESFFLLWTIAFSCLSLYLTWLSGVSDGSILAGLIPYSDAAGYLNDSQRILLAEPISDFSARRPIFAATLSGLLFVVDNHLPSALVILTVGVAVATAHAGLVLRATSFGNISAVLMVVFLWIFYRRFVGTALTEHVGLGVGLLAFSCLWRGASTHNRPDVLTGIFLLSIALVARAGVFFILPAIALWCGRFFARDATFCDRRTLAVASGIILAAFVANKWLLTALGGSDAASFSNFSYTLYGLVHGGDWTLALTQHPEFGTLPPNEQASAIYRIAIEKIVNSPTSLLVGSLRAWGAFFLSAYGYAAIHHPYSSALIGALILSVGAALGLIQVFKKRAQSEFRMLIWLMLGFFFSIPFVPPWDADLMRVYAATIPFTTLLPVLGYTNAIQTSSAPSSRHLTGVSESTSWRLSLGIPCFLLFVLPLLARHALSPLPPATHRCTPGTLSASVRAIPGTVRTITEGEPGVDKAFMKAIIRAPYLNLPKIVARASDFGSSQLPLARIQLQASSGHAPAEVIEFVNSLEINQRFLIAQMRSEGNSAKSILLVVPSHLEIPKAPAAACLVPSGWWSGAYRMTDVLNSTR